MIANPLERREYQVIANASGKNIGCSKIPLVHEAEALFHIARFECIREVAGEVESFEADLAPEDSLQTALQTPQPAIVQGSGDYTLASYLPRGTAG